EIVEAGRAPHAWRLPAVGQHHEVRAARAERRPPLVAAVQREAEMRLVEAHRPIEIGNRQVDRADRRARIDASAHRDDGCTRSDNSRSTSAAISSLVCSWIAPLALLGKPACTLRTLPSRPTKNAVGN